MPKATMIFRKRYTPIVKPRKFDQNVLNDNFSNKYWIGRMQAKKIVNEIAALACLFFGIFFFSLSIFSPILI